MKVCLLELYHHIKTHLNICHVKNYKDVFTINGYKLRLAHTKNDYEVGIVVKKKH